MVGTSGDSMRPSVAIPSSARRLLSRVAAKSCPTKPLTLDRIAERPKIARHVGGAAGVKGFTLHFDNRHGSFRRDPGNLAPDEFIQHHISDDQAAAARAPDQEGIVFFRHSSNDAGAFNGAAALREAKTSHAVTPALFGALCGLALASSLAQPPSAIHRPVEVSCRRGGRGRRACSQRDLQRSWTS